MNIDSIQNKCIVLTAKDDSDGNTIYKFKIYDLTEKVLVYEIEITDKHFISRLISGLYTFTDGHVYFSNNVLKIRYDLINSNNS